MIDKNKYSIEDLKDDGTKFMLKVALDNKSEHDWYEGEYLCIEFDELRYEDFQLEFSLCGKEIFEIAFGSIDEIFEFLYKMIYTTTDYSLGSGIPTYHSDKIHNKPIVNKFLSLFSESLVVDKLFTEMM